MPPVIEVTHDYAHVRLQPSKLMNGSLMSSEDMEVFASFCIDSGATE